MFVGAVTGTNGKTSTVEFTRQILAYVGEAAASYGTLGITTPRRHDPDPFVGFGESALPRMIDRLDREGVESVAVEAFSSSLLNGMFDAVDVDAAGFTNLSRDHLSYHDSMEEYFAAKRRLFDPILSSDGTAVLNIDDERGVELASVCRSRGLSTITYGRNPAADIQLHKTTPTDDGSLATITASSRRQQIPISVIGDVMVRNALCALGIALATGIDIESGIEALSHLTHPEGRLDRIASLNGAELYVDYAHTPDALAAILNALKARTTERIVLVFGCGGDRDTGKRRQMGEVAQKRADLTFVTDDNPRGEDPATIRSDVLNGCPDGIEVSSRRTAIERGITELEPGDILLVAGKGHERHQIIDGDEIPFSDSAVISDIVSEKNRQENSSVTKANQDR